MLEEIVDARLTELRIGSRRIAQRREWETLAVRTAPAPTPGHSRCATSVASAVTGHASQHARALMRTFGLEK